VLRVSHSSLTKQALLAHIVFVAQFVEKQQKSNVKASHTLYRALGPELILVYRQSARRWL